MSVPLPDFSTLPLPVRDLPAGVHRLHGWSGYHCSPSSGKGKYGAVIQRGGARQCAALAVNSPPFTVVSVAVSPAFR